MKKFLSLLLAILLIATPFSLYAKQEHAFFRDKKKITLNIKIKEYYNVERL